MALADDIQSGGKALVYDKGETIFRQGETDPHLYFVQKGFLKAYYLTASGKEYVKTFVPENDFIGSSNVYRYPQTGCTFTLVCLEPSRLLRLKYTDLINIVQQTPESALALINMLIDVIAKKERREFEFLCLSAEERYQQILKNTPELLKRATQNDIARYLGITPVALSRIRSRMTGNPSSALMT
ncbi:MAG: Crp/Fnr family transcriptional regulator [Nitrospirae bacterium]|nr:Crp/Fnr family transcriptional regulator [Candidatus Manganitrophaceae bacterium]